MAEGDIKFEVSLEKAAHEAFKNLAKWLMEEHGLMIEAIHIDWATAASVGSSQPLKPVAVRVVSRTVPQDC